MKPIIYNKIPRIDPVLVERARSISVADLHEGLGGIVGRQCLMLPAMRPMFPQARICGQAITSYNYPGDNLMLHVAAKVAEEGDVVVATNGGSAQGALWGDMITFYAKLKGLGGAVIDGAARDSSRISELDFPVFSTAISVSHPEKRGPGAVNVPIVMAGVTVHPGDLICADADGVLVIPPKHLEAALSNAEARAAKESAFREELKAGKTMFELLNLQADLDQAGVQCVDHCWSEQG
ncbi:4-carboxy-4-hydroxy-2-oxoadipate aldolase/oxaloacetate decarboxylase [Phaeobacter gallaeciensis]|jgi:4-hydroxy-4-methyl-2-oxoglutarate aldolase|uniref:Putative 4-hydroxy-4-methyl-2-oxoglutarate aldolase n=1 Tax=Phaeobacter gallaeciensis TaxID=60890 RepID=A0ABD4XDS0_9RHOB|nr:4-carboxy-4-hydroxy-2-oxoadipate aldolase/oxaloacetate decarboxylase [Phaeobacter gallaeciensis]MDE4142227.1 4-carboxy-4-hydroxy-2-oxoadipate aldolase/oxaloacetate decarboxylase [Phaeobacter gallaeciensis]MDE4146577.1 4-carboxy-4-hydroxy-2-oxoadipate aldolase/oxaloacetate decarboxylase [Phaeobacter gallaeciensis]MDE4150650.1 4-carboxy-4-hydroxy-2-oxoadipate aldolase/oxaloacetate decarboxylase [Phaeobacter gallaeciensis]MDE4154829.1 4-carboxy-4-hydroxy-2-oxoadipate aldolase/oxaloacetate decar